MNKKEKIWWFSEATSASQSAVMIKFIAIDLDHTLIFPRGGKTGLFRIFQKHHIAKCHTREVYEKTKQCGFSVENFLRVAKEYAAQPLNTPTVKKDIESWLGTSTLRYPDVLPFVTKWRNEHIPVIIITVGAPEFQKKKIKIADIPHDDIYILDAINKKSNVLRMLCGRFGTPGIFIDDKASELDALFEDGITPQEIFTCRIRRKESPYYNQEATATHHIDIDLLDDQSLVSILTP